MHEVEIYWWRVRSFHSVLVQCIWEKASLLTVVKKEPQICTPYAMQRERYSLKDMQYPHHACSAVNSRSLTELSENGICNDGVENHDCLVIQGRGGLWLYCQKQLTWRERPALVLVQLEFCSPIPEACMCTWNSLHLAVLDFEATDLPFVFIEFA